MRVLYIGDIMGKPGRSVVARVLPSLKKEREIDVVIAQSENVTHGKGMTPQHMKDLMEVGVDVFSGGNHTVERESLNIYLEDEHQPVIRPANMNVELPGRGYYIHSFDKGKLLVVSILGETFPKSHYQAHPLDSINAILSQNKDVDATVVNFHGDFSSQKRIIGYFLDGRVSAVIGDHWHVPTADALVLPGGTAHITDVGMCGTLHTSLGLDMDGAIERWKDPDSKRGDITDHPPYQFNAVIVDIKPNGLAKSIESINIILDNGVMVEN